MRALLLLGAVMIASGAQAQRLDTLRMSCAQARDAVARAGAIVLNSGPDIYDRYVSDRRFCSLGDVTEQAFAPTRDSAMCPVGGLCKTPDSVRRLDEWD
ncbi:MAG: hypothetical protein BGP06_13620 [Rhizobiales bacterium 65-9]|nr:hypothetical protein [Hyphomicrobiales bacterium]OJY36734.1 MAG: hypothetical protein BGP06_13620 [Rhizobiales bacterium 65-9]